MARDSGHTAFSLASAMKQDWGVWQVPSFLGASISSYKKVGPICLLDQNVSPHTKFLPSL